MKTSGRAFETREPRGALSKVLNFKNGARRDGPSDHLELLRRNREGDRSEYRRRPIDPARRWHGDGGNSDRVNSRAES